MTKFLIASFVVCLTVAAHAQERRPAADLAADSLTFCMSGNCSGLPETSVFSDSTNNAIGRECIHNAPVSELKHFDGIAERLELLTKANVIIVRDGKCSLTFPVIEGARRERITRLSEDAAVKLRPTAQALMQRLHSAVPERPELLFHLLWSRVVDDEVVWQKTWHEAFGQTHLPDVTWTVYPRHSLTVGTYSYPLAKNDWFAFTTVANSWEFKSTIVELAPELDRLARGEANSSNEQRLEQLGFLDSSKKFRVFTYRAGSSFDQLIQELTSQYAAALSGVYDYRSLANSFGVSPQEMFCMLLHETAYAMLNNLRNSGDLDVPTTLAKKDAVQLISIKTAD